MKKANKETIKRILKGSSDPIFAEARCPICQKTLVAIMRFNGPGFHCSCTEKEDEQHCRARSSNRRHQLSDE